MFKTGIEYADDVRELRAQGIDFPSAASGYILADAANWSSGQKAAVTRAINLFDFEDDDDEPEAAPFEDEFVPEGELSDAEIETFWDDAVGDNFEEWDDIDYLDFDEADALIDEESDDYDED